MNVNPDLHLSRQDGASISLPKTKFGSMQFGTVCTARGGVVDWTVAGGGEARQKAEIKTVLL